LSPLAGMDKRVVQKQAKTTVVETKITRSFLPGDPIRVQCIVHNNIVWKEGEIVNPVISLSYDVMCYGKLRTNCAVKFLRNRIAGSDVEPPKHLGPL
jgi:hypothetical protein